MNLPVEVLKGSASAFGLDDSSDQWPNEYLLVSEWPSADAASEFWNSDGYRKLESCARTLVR